MMADYLFLAELTVYDRDTASERVLRFASQAFTTRPTESPANAIYDAVIAQPVDVRRNVFAPGRTQGKSEVAIGDLVLNNADGALDALIHYAFDGRPVIVRRGEVGAAYPSEFETIFVGTMELADVSPTLVTIKLRDDQWRLEQALQSNRYAGNNPLPNGLEGTANDLKGKPKPLVFGRVLNAPAACVNTAKLIHQVNDGAVHAVDALYDRGIALTFSGTYASEAELLNDALAPAAGAYKAYLAGGYVRLGSSPVGTITADVTQGTTASDRTAAALFVALLTRMGIAPEQINADDLVAMDAADSAELGIFVDGDATASAVIDRIANTVGAWWGCDRTGQFRFQQLIRPQGDVVRSFTENDIIGPPTRLATNDPERSKPALEVIVRYARNYTPQNDVASGVSDARRAILAEAWREAVARDESIRTVHRQAASLVVESCYVHEADALREAERRLELRHVQRHLFEITAQMNEETTIVDLGHVVGLHHPRYDLNVVGDEFGQLFRVIGVAPNAAAREIRFTLWGATITIANLVTEDDADYLVTENGAYLITEGV